MQNQEPKRLDFNKSPSVLAFMTRALLPSKGFAQTQSLPEFHFTQKNFFLSPTICRKAFDLTTTTESVALPVYFLQILSFRLVMRVVTDPAFPEPIWNALQLRNRMSTSQQLEQGESVDLSIHSHGYRFLEKGVEADFLTEVHKNGHLCWQNITTFYYRVRHERPTVPQTNEPPVITTTPIIELTMPSSDGLGFSFLSGDFNGIHLFTPYAKMLGFPKAFLHPHRVAGAAIAHLPIDLKSQKALDLWFRGPVAYGANARLAFEKQNGKFCFAVYTDDRRPSLIGCLQE